ncbi:MAG: hypothetical protein HOI95_07360 [Chromatiales bacterium]|nr:hypothetical protein [Chromatiales bacterium]
MTEAQFRAELEAGGYAIQEVTWDAGKVNPKHTHDFSARLMCLEGTVRITTADADRQCAVGDTIEITALTEHTEEIGREGVRLLIGRLHT